MKTLKLPFACLTMGWLCVTLLGCGPRSSGSGSSPVGGGPTTYAKPEDAYSAIQAAFKKEDLKAASQIMTDEARDEFAAMMITMGVGAKNTAEVPGLPKADEVKAVAKKAADVLNKNGWTEAKLKELKPMDLTPKSKEGIKKLVDPVADKGAFIAEMFPIFKDFIKAMGQENVLKEMDAMNEAKLSGVTITGDTAKGTVTTTVDGKEKKEPIEFQKEKGSWKVHKSK
jgi:hypothetical protein